MSVLLHSTILNDDHAEPHVCITDTKTGQIVSQLFNFVDLLGGKQGITAESKLGICSINLGIERLLALRGVLQPGEELIREIQKTQKLREQHLYLIQSSHLSGDAFQLDAAELKATSDFVKEMDTIDILQLDPTFKYADGITRLIRDVEDPFEREIKDLRFQQNPAEPNKLIKALDLF